MRPDPEQRPMPGDEFGARATVPVRAVRYWRLWAFLVGVPLSAATVAGAAVLPGPALLRWAIAGLLVGYLVLVQGIVAPVIRRRIFWYAVSADEIDVQHGWVLQTRTVIPMNRVQHLDTRHGPVADRFRLATVDVFTAAGKITLQALDQAEAESLRRRISALAGLSDDV